MIWTKGKVEIIGGQFLGNDASDDGGVIISADGSTTILAGGVFKGNKAFDGGIVFVGEGSELRVEGGNFAENEAHNSGGAFSVSDDGNIKVGNKVAAIQSLVHVLRFRRVLLMWIILLDLAPPVLRTSPCRSRSIVD